MTEQSAKAKHDTICLVVGAGGTVADVARSPAKRRPPLDRDFFRCARLNDHDAVKKIMSYVEATYGHDLAVSESASLEKTMARVYTDIFDPQLKAAAVPAFTGLIELFNRCLAATTNVINASKRRYVYRLLTCYLNAGVGPSRITTITFNQDIQIEKMLARVQQTAKWASLNMFSFPFCYRLGFVGASVSRPSRSGSAAGKSIECFAIGDPGKPGIPILKLHGSLNWYSLHRAQHPSPTALFNPGRRLRVTCRKKLLVNMTYSGQKRTLHTMPVIVPPVTHKSAVMHRSMSAVWQQAEVALRECAMLVVFGYSFPAMDFESSNMFSRAMKANHDCRIAVIDPDPGVLVRFAQLAVHHPMEYYPHVRDFLVSRNPACLDQ